MIIRGDDYIEIMNYLVQQRWEGNEFVAFLNDSLPVHKESLACFGTPYDVREYCHEMSTDLDLYEYMGIRSVYRTMEEAVHDRTLYIEKGGLVDIWSMVMARQQRLEEEQNSNNQNNKVMIIEKNFEFLRDQIKHAGFGDNLEYALREKMEQNQEKFSINFEKTYGNDKVDASLNFKKGTEGDLYFFNTYDLKLTKDNNSDLSVQQSFFNNNNRNTITLKEAYNLLDGRSVNKDMISQDKQEYNVWIKLDFKNTDDRGNFKLKQFGEKYGYDLEGALAKHPIKELQNDQYKGDLIDSLKKGNIQSATFIKGDQEVKQYVEANPQYKSVNLYDANMQKLESRQSQGEGQGESKNQSTKQEGQGEAQEDETKGESKKPRGQRM